MQQSKVEEYEREIFKAQKVSGFKYQSWLRNEIFSGSEFFFNLGLDRKITKIPKSKGSESENHEKIPRENPKIPGGKFFWVSTVLWSSGVFENPRDFRQILGIRDFSEFWDFFPGIFAKSPTFGIFFIRNRDFFLGMRTTDLFKQLTYVWKMWIWINQSDRHFRRSTRFNDNSTTTMPRSVFKNET